MFRCLRQSSTLPTFKNDNHLFRGMEMPGDCDPWIYDVLVDVGLFRAEGLVGEIVAKMQA